MNEVARHLLTMSRDFTHSRAGGIRTRNLTGYEPAALTS